MLVSRPRPPNSSRPRQRLAQFPAAAGNGIAVQPGDTGEQGDAAFAVLASEEANDKPARAFIGGSDETVEDAMLAGDASLGVLATGWTPTGVDDLPAPLAGQTLLLGHRI